MNETTSVITCPDCGADRLQRFGTTASGKQKYRCKDCLRQFVAEPDHLIGQATKDKIIKLLADGVHPATIYKTFGDEISLRWIFELKRKMKANT
jgi:transposase-like protein